MWIASPGSSRSSSTRTTPSSRRSPSSAPPGACGRGSCATASARATNARWLLRFHTQTAGSTLTAQQPDNNIVRTAYQAMAAVLGGTQSLHTNGTDEALSLPTEDAVRIALRTQQILAYETGVADTVDPLAGSYYVEALTDELERRAWEYIAKIDELGGSVRAIEQGYIQREIEEAAYRYQQAFEEQRAIVVGVNRFQTDDEPSPPSCGWIPEAGPTPGGERWRRCARGAITPPSAPRSPRWRTPREAPPTCCRASWPPSRPTPRWARSVTHCAASSANNASAAQCERRRSIGAYMECLGDLRGHALASHNRERAGAHVRHQAYLETQ